MSRCSARIIPARCLSAAVFAAACAVAASAQGVATLARSYADKPTLVNRAALLAYASAHRDISGAIAMLAVAAHDTTDRKADSIATLRRARERLPQVTDYIAYIEANNAFEVHDYEAAGRDCESVLKHEPKSPLAAQAALLGSKAYLAANAPARAIEILRRVYDHLPQPAGDTALAGAYDAAHDTVNAATYYTRVWLEHPATPQAQAAEAELTRLKASGAYRSPPAPALLARATRLIEARQFEAARAEFASIAAASSGVDRDLAMVRIGVADQRARKDAAAFEYLRSIAVATPEADAERLYYMLAATRRLKRPELMAQPLDLLARTHRGSLWRLQALIAGGDEYFSLNQAKEFEPLYSACFKDFPQAPQAPYCHWRVAFTAYLEDRSASGDLLMNHLREYPASDKASAALYFLGRRAERTSDWGAARAWYEQIERSFPNYYYAVLARERRSRPEIDKALPAANVGEFLKKIVFSTRALPATFPPLPSSEARFERARLLRSAALDDFAEMELRFGASTGEQPEAFGLELARVASARSAPEHAIRYLKRYAPAYMFAPLESAPREFWALSFPLPWRDALNRYSADAGLDPFMVAAVIRQESEFDALAVSRAHAYGLTQVLPATARELSRRLHIPNVTAQSLFDPELNIRLGTQYLESLLKQFNGEWEPTLAAYNAGKSRAVAWLRRAAYREPAEFIECIPFAETRNYVQIVLRDRDLYRRLYAVEQSPSTHH